MPSSPNSVKNTKAGGSPARRAAPSGQDGAVRPKRTNASKRNSRPKANRQRTSKQVFLPLLSLWILAVVVLVGLIYWGGGAREVIRQIAQHDARSPASSPQGSTETPHHTPSRPHSTAPVSAGDRNKDAEPAPSAKAAVQSREETGRGETHHGEKAQTQPENQNLALAHVPSIERVPAPPPAQGPPVPSPPPVARAAIVIDDFGQDLDMARKFLDIPLSLTFSVLPYQKYSQEIAKMAHAHHREVILHVPMQPQGYPMKNPGKGALLVSMSSDAVRKNLQTALDASPHFTGINNHMGSRFTETPGPMKVLLTELRQRGLYFLDSSTSPKSVGYSLAQELQVPSRKRDIFLDHTPSEEFVRSQINQLIRKAKIEGSAVAIGHPHEVTLRVLTKEAKRFQEEGIAVVSSAELMLNSFGEARSR